MATATATARPAQRASRPRKTRKSAPAPVAVAPDLVDEAHACHACRGRKALTVQYREALGERTERRWYCSACAARRGWLFVLAPRVPNRAARRAQAQATITELAHIARWVPPDRQPARVVSLRKRLGLRPS